MMKPKVPQMNPEDFNFEFTKMDPIMTPEQARGVSIKFSNHLVKAFEKVRISNPVTRAASIDSS